MIKLPPFFLFLVIKLIERVFYLKKKRGTITDEFITKKVRSKSPTLRRNGILRIERMSNIAFSIKPRLIMTDIYVYLRRRLNFLQVYNYQIYFIHKRALSNFFIIKKKAMIHCKLSVYVKKTFFFFDNLKI